MSGFVEFPREREFDLGDGMKMTLDGVEHRFHVRERDNCVAIVMSQPGWAAHTAYDFWYVSIEDLVSTGIVDEGQEVRQWAHRSGSSLPHGGLTYHKALELAKKLYVREATKNQKKEG